MTRDTKAETRAINTILWRDWDPIGCGVPEDEYESYVWPVYKLLIEDAPRDAIAAHLRVVAAEQIGLGVAEERLQAAVDRLMELRLSKGTDT